MSDNESAVSDRDARLENLAAELTCDAYHLMLRHGLGGLWLHVELALWAAVTETVEKWACRRRPVEFLSEFESRREGFLTDVTSRAVLIALENGAAGPLGDLVLNLRRAFRLVIRRRSHVN